MTVKELTCKLKYPTQICIQYEQNEICSCLKSSFNNIGFQHLIEKYGEKEVICFDIMNNYEEHKFDISSSYCLIIEI